jgi:hypothetical protein
MAALLLLLLAALATLATANTEKLIFLGPDPVTVPPAAPSLPELNLRSLTPAAPSLRANLSRVFPAPGQRGGGESAWLLLDDLAAGQRYEFRVCWAATEPTEFTLDVYELGTVWQTPELIQSLAAYSSSQTPDDKASGSNPVARSREERSASVLLLRVQAAADYFTHHAALMQNPPPVLVDLILDPYVLNVVPRSLLPTAGYLVIVAVLTWFVARWIAGQLQAVATAADEETDKKKR